MASSANTPPKEGLRAARLLMVLSSISPLFILWAIRGITLVSDWWFVSVCIALVIIPNLVLWLRIRTAKNNNDNCDIVVGKAEDHRDHLLVYLFAMLLPFYSLDIKDWRYFASAIAALAFIVFLFCHLNLHYMNLMFAVYGYRVFTVFGPEDDNPHSGKTSFALITRRVSIASGTRLTAYRISDNVYLESTDGP
jgi:hypothetical protein